MNMLELNRKPNIWNPPAVDAVGLAIDIRNDINARQSNQFLYIFRTVPYVDSIYIRYDSNREPKEIRRFAFHEGYNWDPDDEEYFNDHCVREEMCSYNGGAIETVYNYYQMIRPEWHVQRYYNKGLRLLDHIYNCMKQNTAKEILYKAGLDELAAHIDDLDELNLVAGKPSDIYDGLSMRVLKSLNCPYGSILLAEKSRREFVRELNIKFPDI